MQNGHHKDEELYSKLTSQYSEACQAFVLRDFDTTASIVTSLLEHIEQDSLGLGSDASFQSDLDELVRRVWILKVTLLASADDELARNAKQAERELAGLHSRIERFYARRPAATAAPSTSSSPPSLSNTLIHPSLLVAISLAGLKLDIPSFVRRTLQDYFQLLVSHAASSEAALSASQGDISTLDVSHADLSLSGIAVNGHVSQVDGTNGHLTNGVQASNEVPTSSAASRMKSLQRLSRIYSIHLLGKTLNDWSGAKAWIREQADDDGAVAAGIMSHSYAQTLLDILEDTKAQHEQEQLELREAAKSEQERQAEASKRSKRNHTPSTSRNIQSSGASNANGQSPPVRPERSKERSASTQPSSSTSQQSTIPSLDSTPQNAEQETGFSAFRSHLSHFLSTSDSSSVSRRPENHLTYNATTSFDMIRTYLSRFIHSRLLKFMLAFFIVTGFWRRRMARSGKKLELGKMYGRLRDKVVETVKMGGSLGFL